MSQNSSDSIAIEKQKKEQTALFQSRCVLLQLLYSHVIPYSEADIFAEKRKGLVHDLSVCLAGGGLVVYYDDLLSLRMQVEHQREDAREIERLHYARETLLAGQHLIFEEVYSAKDHWTAGKQFLSVAMQKLEGIVIRADDHVEFAIFVFIFI